MKYILFFLSFLLASIFGGWIAFELLKSEIPQNQSVQIIRENSNSPINDTPKTEPKEVNVPDGLNFVFAAERVTPAVVHIRTYQKEIYNKNSALRNFLDQWMENRPGERNRPSSGSGSGVIISNNGYIVTNFHVIEGSDEIDVVLDDKRSFSGRIIGTDPTTDLALIKIEENNLPFVEYGSSDEVRVGEWVLAVGNPFDLTSTVTAGIVSAKGRNINILRNQLAIESFIQTDAAVNPGNSGGALVNLKGELIGVNTAIATRTGSFAGYSFAVPVSLVQKVTQDLLEYGEVQRALLGVIIRDVDASLAEDKGINEIKGVYVEEVNSGSAASSAGIEKGDVIIAIDGEAVNSPSELQEQVAKFRPGDDVRVKYSRDNSETEILVILKNSSGNTALVKREENAIENLDALGLSIQELNISEKSTYNLSYGIKVLRIYEGLISDQTNMVEGFIITEINGETMNSLQEILAFMELSSERLIIEGQYPDGRQKRFQIRQ